MEPNNKFAKKRKAASDSPPPQANDAAGAGTILSANLSLADLDRLIDRRVADALQPLQRENEALLLRCESLERSVQVLKNEVNWSYSAPSSPLAQSDDDDGLSSGKQSDEERPKGPKGKGSELGDELATAETNLDKKLRDKLRNTVVTEKPGVHWEDVAGLTEAKETLVDVSLFCVAIGMAI